MLHQLITDYPRSWPARYGVPEDKVHPLVLSGVVKHGLARIGRWLPAGMRDESTRWIHDTFSRRLAGLIPRDADYFIGLSSYCLEALRASREAGIPCAVEHGSCHQLDEREWIADEAARWGLPARGGAVADWVIDKEDLEFEAADAVFVLSSVARDSLARRGVPPARIRVNHCGVDLRGFRPAEKRDRVFRVVQVGSITLRKGVLTLLDAFSRFNRPGAELWLVGSGLETSGLGETFAKMRQSGVAIKAPVPQSRLGEIYARASVAVLASVADGFGMVVSQAMACGLPVIVTERVGARDLVEEGVNGFVVPVGAPDVIAERLRLLHDDPERRRAMGEAARHSVSGRGSWRAYGDRLAGFIRTDLAA
jgi:glycosyltransferase involved in cell wall biosynthesis